MFEVLSSKKIFHANKVEIYDCQVKDSLPYVVRMAGNNGIKGYIKENIKFANPKNTLTFAQDTFIISYQKFDYFTGNNVKILKQNFQYVSENVLKYIVVCLQKAVSPFSWGVGSSFEFIENLKIKIPIKNENLGDDLENIDFKFMEDFIAELEAQRIAELEAYLITTNLKDYNLTTDEKQALKDFENLKWQEFKIQDLFSIKSYKKRFDANKVTLINNGGFPYIVRTALNNGLKGFIDEDDIYLNSGNTISFGQDTATIFYQENPYFTGDKIKILEAKFNKFYKNNAQFFITSMNKSFLKFSWGSSSFSEKIINNQSILLPIKNKNLQNDINNINFNFIENFIKAIEKLVIKDVVDFADEKISLTKKCIKTPK